MPRISFYGIVIRMFHTEHPPPHFHAEYGEHEAIVGLDPLTIVTGGLPARAERIVLEWAALHQQELAMNRDRASRLQSLAPIDPLD